MPQPSNARPRWKVFYIVGSMSTGAGCGHQHKTPDRARNCRDRVARQSHMDPSAFFIGRVTRKREGTSAYVTVNVRHI